MKIIKTILSWFNPKPNKKIDERDYEWCIIGNIIEEHYWGEEKIFKRGTKHFRPGAKVYCLPEFAGMAHHEKIRVIGKPRKQNRLINVVIRTNLINNFRVQKVFHPKIQFDIGSHISYWGSRRSKNELKELKKLAKYLNTIGNHT